jgi:hypothetical protein
MHSASTNAAHIRLLQMTAASTHELAHVSRLVAPAADSCVSGLLLCFERTITRAQWARKISFELVCF